jgi:hypothetical protein
MPLRPWAAIGVAAIAAVSFAQKAPADAITEARLRAHLTFIAHDLLEGRDSPSRGLDIAAEYIAAQCALWGLKPAGEDGTYFTKVPLAQTRLVESESSLAWTGGKASGSSLVFLGGNAQISAAPVAFMGSGNKSGDRDPFGKVDAKGKAIVVLGIQPSGPVSNTNSALSQARRAGAAAVIIVSKTLPEGGTVGRGSMPMIAVTPEVGAELLKGKIDAATIRRHLDGNLDADAFDVDNKAEIKATVRREEVNARNVVAMLPGSDPALATEYVAVSAHYDHVGMRSEGTDKIFNGADDDGSGTVGVLELAHAFAMGPRPKRTMVFIWHAAEEKGLVGSRVYTDKPTLPLEKFIGLINIDMIGRSRKAGDTNPANDRLTGPDAIYVIGSRRISTEMAETIERANAKAYKLTLDYKYDAPGDTENLYNRSDHANYARKGVPIAFFFDGVHEDYHQVGDEVSKIDFVKMKMVTQTVYLAMQDLGNRKGPLRRDGKG